VRAWVHGVGTSHFGKQRETPLTELAWRAMREAFSDADSDQGRPLGNQVDAVFVGSVFGAPGVAQRALHGLGIAGPPVVTIENACASGTSAFHEAVSAVDQGRYERVLVLGLEQMSTLFRGPILPEETDPEGRTGLAMPGLYAMAASRWLAEGRVTREQMACVSVKNHAHAMHNDRAQYRGRYSTEDVLASPLIADPLTLLECSPISDGAAAAVVGRERGAARDVRVRASVQKAGGLWDHRSTDVWGYRVVADTARVAYDTAGMGPPDVDLAEVHDAFTIGELSTTEALGLAGEGEAGPAAAAGRSALGGAQPVNPSGGLLSRGHPLGATGLAQLAEVVWQLRGDAGARQVPDARIGLVETMGGGVSGVDGNACVVAVLETSAHRVSA
jgi:acetyl-CoA acetyltransferase